MPPEARPHADEPGRGHDARLPAGPVLPGTPGSTASTAPDLPGRLPCPLRLLRPVGRASGERLGKSFIRVQWPVFPLDGIIEKIAERRQRVKRICISMITRRRAVQDTAAACGRLRSSFDIPVSLLVTPTILAKGDLERFQAAGADKIGWRWISPPRRSSSDTAAAG